MGGCMLWLLSTFRYLAMFLDGSKRSCRSPKSFSYLLGNFSQELRSRATGARFSPLRERGKRCKEGGGKRGIEAEINRLRQTEEGGGEVSSIPRFYKGREEKERRLGLMWMFHAVQFLLFELTNFSEWGHLFPQLKTPWGDVSSEQTANNNEWHSISFLLSSYIDLFMQRAQFSLSY